MLLFPPHPSRSLLRLSSPPSPPPTTPPPKRKCCLPQSALLLVQGWEGLEVWREGRQKMDLNLKKKEALLNSVTVCVRRAG